MVSKAHVHQLGDCPFKGPIDFLLLKSVLPKKPIQCPRPGLGPRLLDQESNVLIIATTPHKLCQDCHEIFKKGKTKKQKKKKQVTQRHITKESLLDVIMLGMQGQYNRKWQQFTWREPLPP